MVVVGVEEVRVECRFVGIGEANLRGSVDS